VTARAAELRTISLVENALSGHVLFGEHCSRHSMCMLYNMHGTLFLHSVYFYVHVGEVLRRTHLAH